MRTQFNSVTPTRKYSYDTRNSFPFNLSQIPPTNISNSHKKQTNFTTIPYTSLNTRHAHLLINNNNSSSYQSGQPYPAPVHTNLLTELPAQFKQQLRSYLERQETLRIALDNETDGRKFADQQLVESNKKVQTLSKQLEEMENQFALLKDKYRRLKKINKNQQEELEGKQSQHKKNKKELTRQYETLGYSQPKENFQQERQLFIKEQEALRDQIKQLEYKLGSYDSIKEQELKLINKQYESDIRKLKTNEERLLTDLKTLSNMKQSLQKQLEAVYRKMEEKETYIAALNEKLGDLEREQYSTKGSIDVIQHEIERLRHENNHLKIAMKNNEVAYKRQLERQMRESAQTIAELKKELAQQQNNYYERAVAHKKSCGLIRKYKP